MLGIEFFFLRFNKLRPEAVSIVTGFFRILFMLGLLLVKESTLS